jgi:Cu-Zn family superoxide dismutase
VQPLRLAVLAAAVLAAGGCTSSREARGDSVGAVRELFTDPTAVATAALKPVRGSDIEGKVTFAQYGAAVVVRASFLGLAPNRDYSLHIHENRDCASVGTSGGHFNPGGAPHGRPGRSPHHAGDLPNVAADGEGNVSYAFETTAISLAEGATNVLGRVIVLSRDKDDFRTQPDGGSGPPLACGLIRRN